jgi:hypothetical protein
MLAAAIAALVLAEESLSRATLDASAAGGVDVVMVAVVKLCLLWLLRCCGCLCGVGGEQNTKNLDFCGYVVAGVFDGISMVDFDCF